MPDSSSQCNLWPLARQRNAATLVEVLGTLSVLLVLGVSAASILGSITQVGVRSNHAMLSRASVERLAKTFRHDVHQASEIRASEEPLTLDLTIEAVTIRYQWNAKLHAISRTASEGEQQLSIDMFEIPEDFRPAISVTDSLAVLRLNDQEGRGNTERRWVIEAIRS